MYRRADATDFVSKVCVRAQVGRDSRYSESGSRAAYSEGVTYCSMNNRVFAFLECSPFLGASAAIRPLIMWIMCELALSN